MPGSENRWPYILGGILITIGSLSVIWQAVNVAIHELTSVACAGFWCGAVFIIAGTLGVLAGRSPGRCSLISWLIFSALAVVFGLTQLAIGLIGTWLESIAPMTDSTQITTTPYPQREAKMTMDVFLALYGLTATVVSIVSCVVAGRAACAQRPVPYETMGGQTMAVAYEQQPGVTNSPTLA